MIVDKTGTPRSDREIEDALQAVKTWIVTEPLARGPDGTPKAMHLVVVKEALEELLSLRKNAGNGPA